MTGKREVTGKRPPPRGDLDGDLIVLIADPNGGCHLVNETTGEHYWSISTGGRLWISDHEGQRDYADVELSEYKVRLKHYIRKHSQLVPFGTADCIKAYFDNHYATEKGETHVFIKQKRLHVIYGEGLTVRDFDPEIEDGKEEESGLMIINRIDYYVHRSSPLWSVRFSIIQATFPNEDGNNVRCSCAVYHTLNADCLIQVWQGRKIKGLPNVDPLIELLENTIELQERIKEEDEKLAKKSEQLKVEKEKLTKMTVLGTSKIQFSEEGNKYDEVSAVIEVIHDDIHETLKRLRVVNYHPNLCTFYGWEDGMEGCFVAFENEDMVSLTDYVTRDIRKYEEMSPNSLKIIRGLAEAIRHMHKRNVFHGNLNSDTIFVMSNHTIKVGGLLKTKGIEKESDAHCDMYAFVHAMLFYMSGGRHKFPQQLSTLEQEQIDKLDIPGTKEEIFDLFKKLGVLDTGNQRFRSPQLSADEILKHVVFRPSGERLRFVQELCNYIKDKSTFGMLRKSLSQLVVVPDKNWAAKLKDGVVAAMEKVSHEQSEFRTSDGSSLSPDRACYQITDPFDLIDLMRNSFIHLHSLADRMTTNGRTLADDLGRDELEIEKTFRSTFPKLFLLIDEAVQKYQVGLPLNLKRYTFYQTLKPPAHLLYN